MSTKAPNIGNTPSTSPLRLQHINQQTLRIILPHFEKCGVTKAAEYKETFLLWNYFANN